VVEQSLDAALAASSERDCQVEQAESRDLVVRALGAKGWTVFDIACQRPLTRSAASSDWTSG